MQKKTLRFGRGFKVVMGNKRSQAAQMVLRPGKSEGDAGNRHRGADQWLYVRDGEGVAILGNRRRLKLGPGTLLLIERGERHEIRATGAGDLVTLNFYVPPAYRRDGDELSRGKR